MSPPGVLIYLRKNSGGTAKLSYKKDFNEQGAKMAIEMSFVTF